MSDKELIFQAANTFTKNLVSNLFGINTIGTDALITYVVNNMEDKYGMYLGNQSSLERLTLMSSREYLKR